MKKYLLFSIFFLSFLGAYSQSISVKSFRALPMDMTASSREGKRIDQNGNVAALIKVVTNESNFVFEGGTLGIVDTKQQVSEVWVWVPRGLRKITIKHPQLGQLRDYFFPIEIEAERTYEMVLTTAKIETSIKEEVKMQYLTFQITPPNAILMVNDEFWNVEADGSSMKFVDFGTYTYRVQAPNYLTDAGKVTVNDMENAQKVVVNLKPDFVDVTLKVDANAEIWVNNEKKGIGTWKGSLGRGNYKIECKQEGHETSVIRQEITSEMSGQTITLPMPRPIYGSLNVESTPNFCQLFIDGQAQGNTPKFIPEILVGRHEIRLVKEGCNDYTETVSIAKDERKQVKAELSDIPKNDETFTIKGVSFTMKFVEGGTFQMGATKEQRSDAFDSEKPVHSVTLSDYYIGETEVTQALWMAVMGSELTHYGGWESLYGKGNDYPAYRVSWIDIQDFLRKLSQLTGKYFRLPTEAEWEYAARGGRKSRGYKFAGSNRIEDVAWYSDNSGSKTHAVKTKSPNELGLYDMTGNVWEWCQDWYGSDYYGKSPSASPQGPSSGSYRVLRGGSWYDNARYCRVSFRIYNDPDSRLNRYGFRLCLSQ